METTVWIYSFHCKDHTIELKRRLNEDQKGDSNIPLLMEISVINIEHNWIIGIESILFFSCSINITYFCLFLFVCSVCFSGLNASTFFCCCSDNHYYWRFMRLVITSLCCRDLEHTYSIWGSVFSYVKEFSHVKLPYWELCK